MPVLADLLSSIDNTKRTVSRRLSDMFSNPVNYAQMIDDRAKNYNENVVPTIQGDSLLNRPLTEDDKRQKNIDLAMSMMPMGVGTTKAIGKNGEVLGNYPSHASMVGDMHSMNLISDAEAGKLWNLGKGEKTPVDPELLGLIQDEIVRRKIQTRPMSDMMNPRMD